MTEKMEVRVRLGPTVVSRHAATPAYSAADEPDFWGPVVTATATLTVLFGDGPASTALRTSKKIRGRAALPDINPTEQQWAEAERLALGDVESLIARHRIPFTDGEVTA